MTFLSFDVNATRISAVTGSPGEFAFVTPLEPPHNDLPMVLALERSTPAIGSPGLLLCRERPHLVYRDFLADLPSAEGGRQNGERRMSARWSSILHQRADARRSPFHEDSQRALALIFQHLHKTAGKAEAVSLTVPPYLLPEQVHSLNEVARASRWPVVGSIVSPLALALAAFAQNPWFGSALVIDVDDHTLWLSLLQEAEGHAHLIESYGFPHLSLRQWKQRLLNALADCCIMQSRRDPRESPSAEQSIYMQIDSLMENCLHNRAMNITFQTTGWFQHLSLQPEVTESFCSSLVQQIVAEVAAIYNAHPGRAPSAVILSAQAAYLPGLAISLAQYLDTWSQLHFRQYDACAGGDVEDFGEALLQDEDLDTGPRLMLLPPEAGARGTHMLGHGFLRSEFRSSHLNAVAPLPEAQAPEAGPARLHFLGRDYFLPERVFTIGRRHDCDLVLEREQFPAISPWHCEILYDPHRYIVRDLSREGTFVNDRRLVQPLALNAGDWIRLGSSGPLLRFLGQAEKGSIVTTA